MDRMCAALREFGFKIPCLVRSDGEVIDGHLRLKAARKLGITEIPVILCDEWTPAQVKAFRLIVNRSATWADWDEDLLAIELMDLRTSDYDLCLTGFNSQEIDDFLLHDAPDEDIVPPAPNNPVSRIGDLWLCGSHRVLCGDATDAEAVSRLLSDRKKEAAIEALLTQRNIEEAARAAGIGKQTLIRWMKIPEFQADYQEVRRTLVSQTNGRLQKASGVAASALLQIVVDRNEPASARVRAADSVLDRANEAIDREDVLVRLAALEQAVKPQRRRRLLEVTE